MANRQNKASFQNKPSIRKRTRRRIPKKASSRRILPRNVRNLHEIQLHDRLLIKLLSNVPTTNRAHNHPNRKQFRKTLSPQKPHRLLLPKPRTQIRRHRIRNPAKQANKKPQFRPFLSNTQHLILPIPEP